MLKNFSIVIVTAIVIALPFFFKKTSDLSDWHPGNPILVIVSPHNEAIRYEFGRAFSIWHRENYGTPVKIDWRNVGGTTEISRYLTAQFVAAVRSWWMDRGNPWPPGAGEAIVDRKFNTQSPPTPERKPSESEAEFLERRQRAQKRWESLRAVYKAFRQTDDFREFTSKIDLFFGGGEYDHTEAFQKGLTAPPWSTTNFPDTLFVSPDGVELLPEKLGGEVWRTPNFFGTALSAFGICYNFDRLRDLGVESPPTQWDDLANPIYFRQLGLADPTKSGSIAKAFEMIIQQKCHQAVRAAGYTEAEIDRFEKLIEEAHLPVDEIPATVPLQYQRAVEKGWEDGIKLIQRIGANARYFTDSSGKVPIDVSAGDAAAGLAIDFYARYQAECTKSPNGEYRMAYITPVGGSSVSCDPISLLRGAEHRETAVRFIQFVLSESGQQLWCYKPAMPGGPEKFALRRLPIRRDFYPSAKPLVEASYKRHSKYTSDDLADAAINPYELAKQFIYRSRWTGRHFGIQRDLIKAMCLDSADELRSAWETLLRIRPPLQQAAAIAMLGKLPDRPEPLTWQSSLNIVKKYDRLDYMREWTTCFREQYIKVKETFEQQEEE